MLYIFRTLLLALALASSVSAAGIIDQKQAFEESFDGAITAPLSSHRSLQKKRPDPPPQPPPPIPREPWPVPKQDPVPGPIIKPDPFTFDIDPVPPKPLPKHH